MGHHREIQRLSVWAHLHCLHDNNPLTYMLSTARLHATGHCCLAALASYDFDIKYHPGVNNADTDALSRLPAVHKSQTVRAVCSSLQTVLHGMPYSLSKGDSNSGNCFGRTVLYMCLLYLG